MTEKKPPTMSTIRIVPDANILYGDPFLESVSARAIAAASQFIDSKLTLADLTIDELRGLLKEQLEDIVRQLTVLTQKAASLKIDSGVNKWLLNPQIKKAEQAWESRIVEHATESPNLPYPEVDAKDLTQLSISQRRPFTKGDKGMRDYLLWSSILSAAKKDKHIYILVTNDHGFFKTGSDEMHENLEAELATQDLSGRVLIRRTLSSVVDEYVKPHLKTEQIVEVAIKSGQIPDFTEADDSVDILVNEYFYNNEIPDEWIIDNRDYRGIEFDVAQDIAFKELISTLQLDDSVLVTSEWEASLTYIVSSYDYQEESETANVDFTVQSIVNPKTLKVESHEISEFKLTGWWDENTGERIPL